MAKKPIISIVINIIIIHQYPFYRLLSIIIYHFLIIHYYYFIHDYQFLYAISFLSIIFNHYEHQSASGFGQKVPNKTGWGAAMTGGGHCAAARQGRCEKQHRTR
jgi:hypothetical protein